MLSSTYHHPSSTPAPEVIQEQDLGTAPGSAMLSQFNSTAEFLAGKGDFLGAITFYEKITNIDSGNGAAWTALGHCYLLTDNLQKAFDSYQRALYSLSDVRDPQLWYGIGLLYEKVRNVLYPIV
jgi:tetratricopeptide (TPR) repeat protein